VTYSFETNAKAHAQRCTFSWSNR